MEYCRSERNEYKVQVRQEFLALTVEPRDVVSTSAREGMGRKVLLEKGDSPWRSKERRPLERREER
jgi:hypothetical protein